MLGGYGSTNAMEARRWETAENGALVDVLSTIGTFSYASTYLTTSSPFESKEP